MSRCAVPDAMDPRDQRRGIHVAVSDERGRAISPDLARWLAGVAPARVQGNVSIALVSDARVRSLNRRYRARDYATDVLSFPAEKTSPLRSRRSRRRASGSEDGSASPVAQCFLGDIVIARGVARQQARAAGHSERTELRVLALHGLLHLLGYDHERDAGAMARIERGLRRKGGLREGLLERQ